MSVLDQANARTCLLVPSYPTYSELLDQRVPANLVVAHTQGRARTPVPSVDFLPLKRADHQLSVAARLFDRRKPVVGLPWRRLGEPHHHWPIPHSVPHSVLAELVERQLALPGLPVASETCWRRYPPDLLVRSQRLGPAGTIPAKMSESVARPETRKATPDIRPRKQATRVRQGIPSGTLMCYSPWHILRFAKTSGTLPVLDGIVQPRYRHVIQHVPCPIPTFCKDL